MGTHSVDLVAGQFVELRRGGALEADEPAPFDILEPSPNVREVAPGEPLHVAWSAPPEGTGPLAST